MDSHVSGDSWTNYRSAPDKELQKLKAHKREIKERKEQYMLIQQKRDEEKCQVASYLASSIVNMKKSYDLDQTRT